MTELDRVLAFMVSLENRAAERLEPFPWGTAVIHDWLDAVYDLNFLRLEHGAPSAAELAAECERIQGGGGFGHRLVAVSNEDGIRLAGEFAGLGWTREQTVIMVHHREPDRVFDLGVVEEVGAGDLRPVWTDGLLAEERFQGRDDVVRQLVDRNDVVASAVPTRYFAARVGGRIASYCDLYVRDGAAQIEAVNTVPDHRGRGLASAVVLRALAESRAAGADLTFLVADLDDWPQHLYVRLGFDEIGRTSRFLDGRGTA